MRAAVVVVRLSGYRGRAGKEKETIDDISGSRLWSQFLNYSRVAENDGQNLRGGAGHSRVIQWESAKDDSRIL